MTDPNNDDESLSCAAIDQDLQIVAHIKALVACIAKDSDGKKSDGARALEYLRKDADREKYLRDLVLQICPSEHDPELWLRWLAGGADPFSKKAVTKPPFRQQNSGRELSRTSKRIETRRRKVEQARAALQAAEADLERGIEYESAIVTWAIMNTITSLVSPIFAMGPAWALMRVISPHVEDEEMQEELILETHPKDRERTEKAVREERGELSRRIHETLDLWCGDMQFEIDLREAITTVVKVYEPRKNEARSRGRKVRTQREMERTARASSSASRRAMLGINDE